MRFWKVGESMFHKKWIRIVALCLSVVLLISVATAATTYTLDLSGDGKVNLWDFQLAVNDEKEAAHKEAIMDELLGGGDEWHKNTEGQWEIWSAVGLDNLAKNAAAGDTFVLMADIDLHGADWTPIANFQGTFHGNGKTISNVKITRGATANATNMGFFGNVAADGTIKDLNLRNISITATEKANYMGLVAGSNRGTITNVTATGIITDTRTEKPVSGDLCYGALVGGCSKDGGQVKYTLTGGTGIRVADSVGKYTTTGLCADVKFAISAEGSFVHKNGVAGWAPDYSTVSGVYCDSTNATTLLSETEQTRRATVVNKMYEMGTVKWTPSETITFTKHGNKTHIHSNIYIAGQTYTGIPYVGGMSGSYERFLSQMASQDSNGVYTTVTGLKNGTQNEEDVTDPDTGIVDKFTGHVWYIGSNCTYAVGWAWATISPSKTDGTYKGVGAHIASANYSVPTAANQSANGVIPVGGYKTLESNTDTYASGAHAMHTPAVIADVGVQNMAECYAQAHMGDALAYAEYSNGTYDNSHIRMVAADPVIIRNSKGVIDLEASYVLTHEQGDGLYDSRTWNGTTHQYTVQEQGYGVKHTSWRLNHKYTLSILLTEDGYNAAMDAYKACGASATAKHPGCGYGYVPVTMAAFSGEEKTPYYTLYAEPALALPETGRIYSNYWINSATMTIKDADGNTLIERTEYALNRGGSTMPSLMLSQTFDGIAQQAGLEAGKTYYCTVSILASNGKTYLCKNGSKDVINNTEFVYTPAQ